MRPAVRSFVARYGTAAFAVAAALSVRLALDPMLGDRLPFLIPCLAVVVVAWHGGFGPSLLALLLALPGIAYFFLAPRHDLANSLAGHPVQVSGFLFLGLTIGLFSERLRAARRRAEALASEAVRRRAELEREVAERQRLEKELQRRADTLADADSRKDEFLAMLGHELRNPLAPIRNAVLVLRRLGTSDPDLRRSTDLIDRQVHAMTHLVDELLDVSRITRGKIRLQREPVDLAAVVARGVETARPLLDARRHVVTVNLPPDPIQLHADPTRLAQVIGNLLTNAAKYTHEGGHVELTVERLPGAVVVRVRDDGVGIPADVLPRVFELFTQGDRSPARSEGGLGIGLTLVKTLVELHGGSVEARSEGPGKGSQFVVRLPVPEPQSPGESGAKPAGPTPVSPRRVLVVDDNVDAAESLAMLLRVERHEVYTAHDGSTALAAAAAFRPEIVLLDIGLPRMDGYEVARRLRGQDGFQKTLLVALTGYGQEEDRRRAAAAGFDAYLVKPADPAALHELLAGS
jgi:signal transduction histidine kinase/CheY-like chemotaxis protein